MTGALSASSNLASFWVTCLRPALGEHQCHIPTSTAMLTAATSTQRNNICVSTPSSTSYSCGETKNDNFLWNKTKQQMYNNCKWKTKRKSVIWTKGNMVTTKNSNQDLHLRSGWRDDVCNALHFHHDNEPQWIGRTVCQQVQGPDGICKEQSPRWQCRELGGERTSWPGSRVFCNRIFVKFWIWYS